MVDIKFNTNKFPFREKLEVLFNVTDLSSIDDQVEIFKRETDQSTNYHKIYYDWARTKEFKTLYQKFITQVIRPIYDESIVYQTIPTFRVCYPNNIAVGEFHKDKHYRHGEWAAKVKEDNFFFPMTKAFNTNTIWVESEEDKGDYSPMECDYGTIIKWDGCNLMHGNKINTTSKCRISVDFRVIKKSNYIPLNQNTINTGMKFEIGGYYSEI